MSIRSIVTMGYSNGTFSIGTSFLPRLGYSGVAIVDGPGEFTIGEVFNLGFQSGENYRPGIGKGEIFNTGFRIGENYRPEIKLGEAYNPGFQIGEQNN